jgi:hypothetical protein
MRAELRSIEPNDYPGWEAFAAAPVAEPWNHFGWFTLSIGREGSPGEDLFQVVVTTPGAVSRATSKGRRFRGLVIDWFEPEAVARRLRAFVSSAPGHTWEEIVDQLREVMLWEYEGMPRPW